MGLAARICPPLNPPGLFQGVLGVPPAPPEGMFGAVTPWEGVEGWSVLPEGVWRVFGVPCASKGCLGRCVWCP